MTPLKLNKQTLKNVFSIFLLLFLSSLVGTQQVFSSESHYIRGISNELSQSVAFEACLTDQNDHEVYCKPLGDQRGYDSKDLNFRVGMRKLGAASLGVGEGILSAAGIFVASVWLYGTAIIYSGVAVIDSIGLITVSVGVPVAITKFDFLNSLNPIYWWDKANLLKRIRPDQLEKSDFYVNFENIEDLKKATAVIDKKLRQLTPVE